MKKENLIKRTYRISKENDRSVKKSKKKFKSESGVIRNLIKNNLK